jgi:inner membrane protein
VASPLGHSLIGYTLAAAMSNERVGRKFRQVLGCILIANAPDLDFLPGMLLGKPNLFHHGISHSLGVGILFSLTLAALVNWRKRQHIRTDFLIFFTLYASHLMLDYISSDGRPPLGIPLFWPLSNEYFLFPHPILPGVMHSKLDHATIVQFLDDVFSVHNLYVVFLEIAMATPLLLIIFFLRKGRHERNRFYLKDTPMSKKVHPVGKIDK